MQTALLLIDLQQDFLVRPGLHPSTNELISVIHRVLSYARAQGMPIGHVRTRVDPDDDNRMPHWRRSDTWACVANTPGEEPPPELAALPEEPVFFKQFFSGFADPLLDAWLKNRGVEEIWVVGIYTHGCVRATVLDAYERGYKVIVVDDGVASTDPVHARITCDYLNDRASQFVNSAKLLQEKAAYYEHYSPHEPDQLIAGVEHSDEKYIESAVKSARKAQRSWSHKSIVERIELLRVFAQLLEDSFPALEERLIHDLGKPRRAAQDELRRALGHVTCAVSLVDSETLDDSTRVAFQPRGVIAIVTPWNNPVAIPAGKLSAALVMGNAVVWKPAFQADSISRHLLSLLRESGIPPDLVEIVNGGPREVVRLASSTTVDAVSLTGPEAAGKTVAAICAPVGKPLQAELGGNNALLVMADSQLETLVSDWARLAFTFAGQRCTALRRFVVEKTVFESFEALLRSACEQLHVTQPESMDCDVGPLISKMQLDRVDRAVRDALQRGARLIAGGKRVPGTSGHYYEPTILTGLSSDDPLVQEELFGPVAVIQTAEDFDDGIALVNGVRQGLLAGISTGSIKYIEEFVRRAEVGIIMNGASMSVHPEAPFGGMKASQIGPPEHGHWDRFFYTQPRTIYE
jgi:acyl-CoA reductase-like NAD-dependent aldehyde dehydrogenase/nicotinamidase-related amidase